jgi:hypothetical protein
MTENKTAPTGERVEHFINSVGDDRKRRDSRDMIAMMTEITGKEPRMWGSSLVGFGQYHYRYESGREGDSFITGFSPRKSALTIYIMPGFSQYGDLLKRLGPHRTGKSCLYLNNLDAVDREVLQEIVRNSVERMREKYDCE